MPMFVVTIACCLLVVGTTVLHYEVLRGLNGGLPSLGIPNRTKLLIVIIAAFLAHAAEMAMYGLALYALVKFFGAGTLAGAAGFSLASCLYFSAETYTSLGFGDLTPFGPMRLLAGAEALNGLLLIGWSASFIYISMERFWGSDSPAQNEANPPWSVFTFRRFSERSILIGSAITISVIFVLDLLTGVEIRLHVLYIFPLAMVATNCAQPGMSIAAIVITTILQVITFSIQAIGIVAFLADICVAFAASVLTIVLGRASRSSYLVAVNQAATDPLTGLANRRAFLGELQAEIARQQRYGDPFSLAILDLDGLKVLNDSKSHSAGDEALKLMAEILRFGTRKSDTLGRLGGDEFAVLMPNTQDSDCGILLQKLCETIARQMAAAGFAITASVGCRTFRVPPESAADALQQADEMMYDAKRDGKNRVVQT